MKGVPAGFLQNLFLPAVMVLLFGSAGAQEYVLTGPAGTQYLQPNYNFPIPQFLDSYLPQRDLQTSDLPLHLQQTLPQYRFTTPKAFYAKPSGFRAASDITTHRPNYSHFFANSHNRSPQQSETFLGEITLQTPEKEPPPKPKILNHRTRIFAPEDDNAKSNIVKDYFVNNEGEVFATTESVTEKSTKKTDGGMYIEPLLEEPIKSAERVNDDRVEVVSSNDDDDEEEEETTTDYYDDYEEEQEGTTTEVVTTTQENKEPEVVVSVVTTKSVINNTVIPTVTIPPEDNSTNSWISVQTSRSISYLDKNRDDLLNETQDDEETTTSGPVINTESLIDKLDRVQSDLSSSVLTNNFNDETDANIAVISETTTKRYPQVQIKKFSPLARPPTKKQKFQARSTTPSPPKSNITELLPVNFKGLIKQEDQSSLLADILRKATLGPIESTTVKKEEPIGLVADILKKVKVENSTGIEKLLESAKPVDVSAFLPSGYKQNGTKNVTGLLAGAKPVDISTFLPPGYKLNQTKDDLVVPIVETKQNHNIKNVTKKKGVDELLADAKPVDISAFLPPGYKPNYKSRTTPKPLTTEIEKLPPSLLPPGYKLRESSSTTTALPTSTSTTTTTTTTTTMSSGLKVVFPNRPGGGTRKPINRLTTSKTNDVDDIKINTPPTIQKGWPSRATTEFTGWPTPSTTPIPIEKLLELARMVSSSTEVPTDKVSSTSVSTTSTTTTTTTTPKPTTPGVCNGECDLAGTVKLVGGAKWVPELLDRNTKEWQILANEVETQLEDIFIKSNLLGKWYKKIRIDGFSQGSVLVDYLVELNDVGRQIDTGEIKKLFHESLGTTREPKSLNGTKLNLGRFILDPVYTDFIVLPKEVQPTVGYAEDNVLLPQWAIAVIVIGLASLLFVIIFGVTVLVNRQKNAKKKVPVALTDDMLNELNKNHMSGFDNYGAEDLYNMEDVWNERPYDSKLSKKRSSGSIHDNSMSNLYDSWRSEWNGLYYNNYYANNAGSSHSGYGRRRSDYDTNF